MKKKIIAFASAAVLALSIATTAFAAAYTAPAASSAGYAYGCGNGGVYGLMCDQNGNLLDKDAFEANLNKAIDDGLISAANKDFYLEKYDWCVTNGGGNGVRGGGCGGRGMGRGMSCIM